MAREYKSTKRKRWGRSALVQFLRGTLLALVRARDTEDADVRKAAILEAHEEVRRAAEAMDIYGLDRKRLRAALDKEISHIELLMAEAASIAVTSDEKAIKARERQRARAAEPVPRPVAEAEEIVAQHPAAPVRAKKSQPAPRRAKPTSGGLNRRPAAKKVHPTPAPTLKKGGLKKRPVAKKVHPTRKKVPTKKPAGGKKRPATRKKAIARTRR